MSFFYYLNEEGSYTLTPAGYTAIIIIGIIIFLSGNFFLSKNNKFDAKKLAFSSIALALSMVTSNIKLFQMPMGGSVTLMSMLFVCLIGYWYGLYAGLTTGFALGILNAIVDPYIISLPQFLIDYIFAFTVLGLSGLFSGTRLTLINDNKNTSHTISGLIPGYIVAVLGRYFFSTLSGVIFFGIYAPENFPNPLTYSLIYNGSYLGLEALITVVVILLPPVAKALDRVREMSRQ
ncbi:MAG: energy-coupled thiamine transporter ThiT [Lachnospiraceae bacterium]|nr:energy-coupled thiamine transporter ThiT [Lachnospiraceae bacterium]